MLPEPHKYTVLHKILFMNSPTRAVCLSLLFSRVSPSSCLQRKRLTYLRNLWPTFPFLSFSREMSSDPSCCSSGTTQNQIPFVMTTVVYSGRTKIRCTTPLNLFSVKLSILSAGMVTRTNVSVGWNICRRNLNGNCVDVKFCEYFLGQKQSCLLSVFYSQQPGGLNANYQNVYVIEEGCSFIDTKPNNSGSYQEGVFFALEDGNLVTEKYFKYFVLTIFPFVGRI